MSKPTVAWLAGDPVARSLLDLAHAVLDRLKPDIDYFTGDIGWEPWLREGKSVPDRTLELIKRSDCAMVIVSSDAPASGQSASTESSNQPYDDPWLVLARQLYLHTELRPCRTFPGNPLNRVDSLDIVIFRDLLEGSGTRVGFCPVTPDYVKLISSHPGGKILSIFPPEEIAMNVRIVTHQGFANVAHAAFEFARRNLRKRIAIVDLPELYPETSEMIIQTAREVAVDYPAFSYTEPSLFTLITEVFNHPEKYDVIVTENLFGEMLSRIAAELSGGIGFLSRVAINDERAIVGPLLDIKTHHTTPSEINPFGMLIAVRMLLELLGDVSRASILGKAIEQVIADKNVATPDMGGSNCSKDVVNAVIEKALTYLELL